MTTELERKFFGTFGIEQFYSYKVNHMGQIYMCEKECILHNKHLFKRKPRNTKILRVSKTYPTITDTHYLEMLCILGECDEFPCFETVKELKTETLNLLIANYEDFVQMDYKGSDEWAEELKTKIQALFKGSEK
jgi:hypothetical protein